MMRISAVMAGHPMPPEARADAEEMCRREHRVVLTLSPYATFRTPPRHVREATDLKGLTHLDAQESSLVAAVRAARGTRGRDARPTGRRPERGEGQNERHGIDWSAARRHS